MKNKYKRKTLQQVGEELEKKVLGPFVNVTTVLFDATGLTVFLREANGKK